MTAASQAFVYIGANTDKGSQGIYLSHLDLASGRLSDPESAVRISNPTFLTTDPQARFLYCTGRGEPNSEILVGAVNGFAINRETGALTYLNSQSVDHASFCHISTDHQAAALLAADYGHGTIASFPLDNQGRIGPAVSFIAHQGYTSVNPTRQEKPHVHSINIGCSNQYAFVCDFSADEVTTYRYDADTKILTTLSAVKTMSGAGPRHLAVHPEGQYVYVINELNGSITTYRLDAQTGRLEPQQTISTLPDDFTAQNTSAEIAISPDLRFLYGSNRGHDSIAHYQIDAQTGNLTFVAHTSTGGEHPRNFTIDPTGQFLFVANRDTDNVVVFRLDNATGTPIPTGQQLFISMPMGIKVISKRPKTR